MLYAVIGERVAGCGKERMGMLQRGLVRNLLLIQHLKIAHWPLLYSAVVNYSVGG
jgi:hypothetical protein